MMTLEKKYQKAIGNGYVMSLSIRRSNQELKNFVLDNNGYEYNSDKTYKKKSRLYPREIEYIKTKNGKSIKAKTTVDEKQVVFWSADYAKRAKMERQPAIDKALDLIGNIQKYNKKTSYIISIPEKNFGIEIIPEENLENFLCCIDTGKTFWYYTNTRRKNKKLPVFI